MTTQQCTCMYSVSSVFYRCTGGKDEDDYRPLFENFVQDLLSTLNLPEWPASEAVLTLLARLLVRWWGGRGGVEGVCEMNGPTLVIKYSSKL